MPTSQDLQEAKLRALESEAAKNNAEKERISLETQQLREDLKTRFLGINWISFIKYVVAGVVGGLLVWSFGLEHMLKVNTMNLAIERANVEENARLKIEKEELAKNNTDLRNEIEQLRKSLVGKIEASEEPATEKKVADTQELRELIVKEAHKLEERASQLAYNEQQHLMQQTPVKENVEHEGEKWVYLGEYKDNNWITKYFNFNENLRPEELKGKEIKPIVHSANIRKKKFSGTVIGILSRSDNATVLEVENFPLTNYMWAKIKI